MTHLIGLILAVAGILSLVLLYLAGLGYQQEILDLGTAFAVLRYSAIGGLVAAVLVVAFLVWKKPSGLKLGIFFLSAVMGLTAFYLPYRQSQIASQVPPIHDITTDTVNPPAFIAVAPIRASAPNPITYEGETIASQQREAYPDIMTLTFTENAGTVFNTVLEVVESMGWELVDANEGDGRIEATDTTQWFGFKDDVVIRIQAGPAESAIVDVRSKSRVGRSDIGMNARRIRAFTSQLNGSLGES